MFALRRFRSFNKEDRSSFIRDNDQSAEEHHEHFLRKISRTGNTEIMPGLNKAMIAGKSEPHTAHTQASGGTGTNAAPIVGTSRSPLPVCFFLCFVVLPQGSRVNLALEFAHPWSPLSPPCALLARGNASAGG